MTPSADPETGTAIRRGQRAPGAFSLADAQRVPETAERPGDAGRGPARRFLRLRIGGTPLAIPLEAIREVCQAPPVAALYRIDPIVVGLCALRGEVVAVLDLDPVAPLQATDRATASWMAVLQTEGRTCGILAHELLGIAVTAGILPLVPSGSDAEPYLEGVLPATDGHPAMGILRAAAWTGQERIRRLSA